MPISTSTTTTEPDLDGLFETRGVTVGFSNHSLRANSEQSAEPRRYMGPTDDFGLLQSLRKALFHHARSVALCGRGVIGDVAAVLTTGRLAGVMRCHNPHICPVCACTLARSRMTQARVCVGEARKKGLRVLMATFTSKPIGLPLVEEMTAFDAAMAEFTRSLAGRANVVGYINARDMTHSQRGDWNPHRHMIVTVKAETNLDRLRTRLITKWVRCILSQGGHAIAAAQLVEEVPPEDDEDVITYVLSAPMKAGEADGGATIRDITVAAGAGDRPAISRLNEYAAAMRGRRAVSSGGLLSLAREPEETEVQDEDRVVDLHNRAILELDRQGLLTGLIRRIAHAVDGGAKRLEAHEYLSSHLPVPSHHWFIDWTGYEDTYYAYIDPGEPFDYSGPEWDEPELDVSFDIEMADARLETAVAAIMAAHPGVSHEVAIEAARATPGVC